MSQISSFQSYVKLTSLTTLVILRARGTCGADFFDPSGRSKPPGSSRLLLLFEYMLTSTAFLLAVSGRSWYVEINKSDR